MSATAPEQSLEAARTLLNIQADTLLKLSKAQALPANLQADTLLKLSQARTGPWKLAVGGAAAGAALMVAAIAFTKLFLG